MPIAIVLQKQILKIPLILLEPPALAATSPNNARNMSENKY